MKRTHTLSSLLLGIILTLTMGFSLARADVTSFQVDVKPDAFGASETVDLIITAKDVDGNTVTDSNATILIDLVSENGGFVSEEDWTKPANGTYDFVAADQGTKTFSKALSIKKEGKYKIIVSDILDDTIVGEKSIEVGKTQATNLGVVTVTAPVNGGTERSSSISILGSSTEYPNSPISVSINDKKVKDGKTDSQGKFNIFLSELEQGKNTLQVNVLDAQDNPIAESEMIEFTYNPVGSGGVQEITIDPSGPVKQGQPITIKVMTDDTVSSVKLKLSDSLEFPMDKIKDGEFSKKTVIEDVGSYSISADINNNGTQSTITDLGTLEVTAGLGVSQIKIVRDNTDKTILTVSRKALGAASSYTIQYGYDQNNLNQSGSTTGTEIVLSNIDQTKPYYFKIIPLSESGEEGTASEVIIFEPTHNSAGDCSIQAIPYSIEKMGDQYYLVWNAMAGVTEYSIYKTDIERGSMDRSSLSPSDFQSIGTTSDTRFSYPFDANASTDQYAYFAIHASCVDGNQIDVSASKKVKVGPVEDMLLIMLIAVFGYGVYSLYGYTKQSYGSE